MKTLLTLFLICISLSLSAQTYYVDPTSTGTNTGTLDNPYLTIGGKSMSTGRTYLFKGGTTDTITTRIFINAANVTLSTYGTGRAKICAKYTANNKIIDASIGSSNLMIRNLEFVTSTPSFLVNTIQLWGSPNSQIRNCKVTGGNVGISLYSSTNKIIIDSCEVTGTRIDGIFIDAVDSVYVRYCNVHHINTNWFIDPSEASAPGDNIQIDDALYFEVTHNILDKSDTGNKFNFICGNIAGHPSVFSNNRCYASATTGANLYLINYDSITVSYNLLDNSPFGIQNNRAVNLNVHNNIFTNHNDGGYGGLGYAKEYFFNNVFYNCTRGISCWSDTITARNNIFYNCTYDIDGNPALITSSNNCKYGVTNHKATGIIANPLFVDLIDFKLQTGSPCIDAGIPIVNQPMVDYFGTAFTEPWDIGIFQGYSPPTIIRYKHNGRFWRHFGKFVK